MRDLRLYRAKRDPGRTPEPFGTDAAQRALPPDAARHFVVQQHAARRVHWDLRLEVDGVLASWAVPKGPSLDPDEKRLAVRTEDHPIEYADFEGVIPAGNYGAGAMIVWDRGTYRCVDGRSPAAGIEAGKLDLALEGHKLRGRFALVRTARGEGKEWLLFRKGAKPAEKGELTERAPESVYSGLTVEELRDGKRLDETAREAARRAGAKRAPLDAAKLRPMLATQTDDVPRGDGWLYELKYDGVRALAEKRGAAVRLFARTGGERTHLYPELAAALAHLPLDDVILDGEIVSLDASGRSSFERLQRRFTQTGADEIARGQRETPVVLYAFDLLGVCGFDLRAVPLAKRKALLATLLPPRGPLRFADHVAGDGAALLAMAREHGLEGVVAKRADSLYETGERSKRWRKTRIPRTTSLAIVGALPRKGSEKAIGSLMLAGARGDALVYAGSVGSGLDAATAARLERELAALRREAPAFTGAPSPLPRSAFFVEPRFVAEVRYTEVTSAGQLRQPVFLGLRDDVAVADCQAPLVQLDEPAAPPGKPPSDLQLTRVDKVFWPVEGFTKGDLLHYYEAVWPWLAPYLADRPVVLTRYPDGIEGKSFYQKNAPEFTPEWARRATLDDTEYFVCDDLRTLLYVINSGAIPLHVWSARLASIERPDWLILDLDPKQAPFAHVVEIARHLHALLDDAGATHFVKTSGQAGIHVLLPLGGALTHDEARALAEAIARVVVAERPDIATITRPVAARGDRVYVDFLQNGRGKLIAAPYSVRPRPGAPVSMPLAWREVTKRLDPVRFNLRTAVPRLLQRGDLLQGILGPGVDAVALLEALARRLERGEAKRSQEER